jgi:hypothetical protein
VSLKWKQRLYRFSTKAFYWLRRRSDEVERSRNCSAGKSACAWRELNVSFIALGNAKRGAQSRESIMSRASYIVDDGVAHLKCCV